MKLLPGTRNVIYPFLLGELVLDLCLHMHVLLDGKQYTIYKIYFDGFFSWGGGSGKREIMIKSDCRLISLLGGGGNVCC